MPRLTFEQEVEEERLRGLAAAEREAKFAREADLLQCEIHQHGLARALVEWMEQHYGS